MEQMNNIQNETLKNLSKLDQIVNLINLNTQKMVEEGQQAHDETCFHMMSAPEETKEHVVSSSEEMLNMLKEITARLDTMQKQMDLISAEKSDIEAPDKEMETVKLRTHAANFLNGIKEIAGHARDFAKERTADLQSACRNVSSKTTESVKNVYQNAKAIEKNMEKAAITKASSLADRVSNMMKSSAKNIRESAEIVKDTAVNMKNEVIYSANTAAAHLAYQKAAQNLEKAEKILTKRNFDLRRQFVRGEGKDVNSDLGKDNLALLIKKQKKIFEFADRCVNKAADYEEKMLNYADKYKDFEQEQAYAEKQNEHYERNEGMKEMYADKLDYMIEAATKTAERYGSIDEKDKVKEIKEGLELS